MANTPMRALRIPEEIWEPAREAADREGTNLSEIIRAALIAYTEEHPPPKEGTKP